ncbi:MAG: hydantoinase/oxoprolinase family protein [Lachnospiraceae bacterium]|nr:hydantoinase/oxoprolinase family protein [Lachnospiraceae bacterium]
MKVRIGIDVGGTFTDAAIINNETYELIGTEKIPTTHFAENGVAAGIIEVLQRALNKYNIRPEDVVFIAHGTTQATNALLEGDVAKVGVLTLGTGIEGVKSKTDTKMGQIELAAGKCLITENEYVDTKSENMESEISQALQNLKDQSCEAIVAAEAFSVDKPENENKVVAMGKELGLPSTATNEISKLYGLKVRTRTAVANASIMPKMLQTANMTAQSILDAGIDAKLMIMRCDGGVMTIDEVRNRPILTILSGPAAGVAGALMYEKLTDGLFLEVGGTSTDISCVKDGRVMVQYAQIGGHKTFLTSLDVRTVGIGGGSMVQIKNHKIVETGPRSAHIAGLQYEVYTDADQIVDPALKTVRPTESDPEYAYIECSNGKKFALTLAGAANIAGYVPEGDYARGNIEAAKKAWKPLADMAGMSVEQAAEQVLLLASEKNKKVALELMKDYNMDPRTTVFIGGGGGASTAVPHLAKVMGHRTRNAKNAPVISTIGVALALVRDMVERTVVNPTQEDILAVRREAEMKVIEAGANPATVEVVVEVDTKSNLVRATAIGSTELRTKNLGQKKMTEEEIIAVAAENMQLPAQEVKIAAGNGSAYAAVGEIITKKFGFLKKKTKLLRIIDDEGVIRLQKRAAEVRTAGVGNWPQVVRGLVEDMTEYGDGGEEIPSTYMVYGKRIIVLTGLATVENIISVARTELAGMGADEKVMIVCTQQKD